MVDAAACTRNHHEKNSKLAPWLPHLQKAARTGAWEGEACQRGTPKHLVRQLFPLKEWQMCGAFWRHWGRCDTSVDITILLLCVPTCGRHIPSLHMYVPVPLPRPPDLRLAHPVILLSVQNLRTYHFYLTFILCINSRLAANNILLIFNLKPSQRPPRN